MGPAGALLRPFIRRMRSTPATAQIHVSEPTDWAASVLATHCGTTSPSIPTASGKGWTSCCATTRPCCTSPTADPACRSARSDADSTGSLPEIGRDRVHRDQGAGSEVFDG
jgi:hypothetical protein